jgi:hypothetical protein
LNGSNNVTDFHPMKGPFTTQTLRGIKNSGAMHWRGDRSVGQFGTDPFDSNISFLNFAPAFQTLIGSATMPSQSLMQEFANFQLSVLPPPNPVRNLDNSLTTSQGNGQAFFTGTRPSDGLLNPLVSSALGQQTAFACNECHTLNSATGSFGTGGNQSFEQVPQIVKIPHLRNAYAKVGMFGTPVLPFIGGLPDSGNMGPQVRGFGYMGDGSVDTVFRFLNAAVFAPQTASGFPQTNTVGTQKDVEQFVLAFDSDLAPIVGQQVTLTSTNAKAAGARVTLLEQRAAAAFVSKSLGGTVKECDLVAFVAQGRGVTGYLYDPVAGDFVASRGAVKFSDASLRALAATPGNEVTFLAATPGSGARLGAGTEAVAEPRWR